MKTKNLHNLQGWLARNKRKFPPKSSYDIDNYYFTFYYKSLDNMLHRRSVCLRQPWPMVAMDLTAALNEILTLSNSVYGSTCTLAA